MSIRWCSQTQHNIRVRCPCKSQTDSSAPVRRKQTYKVKRRHGQNALVCTTPGKYSIPIKNLHSKLTNVQVFGLAPQVSERRTEDAHQPRYGYRKKTVHKVKNHNKHNLEIWNLVIVD